MQRPATSRESSREAQGAPSGPDRARTDDLFHAMEALSQLSYRPVELFGAHEPRRVEEGRSRWRESQAGSKPRYRMGLREVRNGRLEQ